MKKLIIIASLFLLFIFSSVAQQKINWGEDLQYAKSYLEIMHPRLFDFVSEEGFNKDFDYLFNNWQNLDDA